MKRGFVRRPAMVRRQARAFLAAVVATWLAAPLLAHDFWLDPSTFSPGANQVVSVLVVSVKK